MGYSTEQNRPKNKIKSCPQKTHILVEDILQKKNNILFLDDGKR